MKSPREKLFVATISKKQQDSVQALSSGSLVQSLVIIQLYSLLLSAALSSIVFKVKTIYDVPSEQHSFNTDGIRFFLPIRRY